MSGKTFNLIFNEPIPQQQYILCPRDSPCLLKQTSQKQTVKTSTAGTKVPTTEHVLGVLHHNCRFYCVYKKNQVPSTLNAIKSNRNMSVCLLTGAQIFTGRWCRSVLLDCGLQSRWARSRPTRTTPSSRCCSARIALWHHHRAIWGWVAVGRINTLMQSVHC